MTLHHILHATITPILILLEIGDEAGSSDARQPRGGYPLHGTSEQQGRNVEA